jgi:hypothetical protein
MRSQAAAEKTLPPGHLTRYPALAAESTEADRVRHAPRHGRDATGGVEEGAEEALAMTTAVYSYWTGAIAATAATTARDDPAWAILAVLLVISALVGWAGSAMQRQWRLDKGDHGLPLLTHDAWGEPDLAPPSTSPEALAEVAELEAIWRQSERRGRSATSD